MDPKTSSQSSLLTPNRHHLPPVPIRTRDHYLIGHPEIDATVPSAFLIFGYSNLQTSYQNLLLYTPLILLDHSYHHLQAYRDTFHPRQREKQHVNYTLSLYHTYFSVLLAAKNDDVMRLLDDMDSLQQLVSQQYQLLQCSLQNSNFRRHTLTDDQSRRYGYLISIVTQLVHACHIAQSIGMIVDKGTKQILDYIEGPLFSTAIPGYERMDHEDSELCNATIRKVNDIIAAYLDQLHDGEPLPTPKPTAL